MRSNNDRKAPCKFKGSCKNYLHGANCPFSHDKCRDGDNCMDKVNCKYFHEGVTNARSISKPKPQFAQSIDQVECKFGAKCNKLSLGKCPFKHTSINENQKFEQR